MSTGAWIFLSVIVVCLTYVFCFTLSKWHWKKILIRGILTLICLGLISYGVVYYYINYLFSPTKEQGYAGINLGYSENDVKFFFGEPKDIQPETTEKGRTLYMTAKEDEYTPNTGDIIIFMRDGKVSEIRVDCPYLGDGSIGPYKLQGISCVDSYQSVIKKFGRPSFISVHKDQEVRLLSYKRYNVYFALIQNKIVFFGVYDPTSTQDGNRRLREEYVEPKPGQSSTLPSVYKTPLSA